MATDSSLTVFRSGRVGFDDNDFVARVPAGLDSREKLFGALRRELKLPDYFGENWDALSDCLRDLSWIKQRRVVIVHSDIPQLGPTNLSTYLDVLADCVGDWKAGDDHELIVAFPDEARIEIDAIVHENDTRNARTAGHD